MGAEPKFFKPSLIDTSTIIAASSGQATVERIFDRDNELKWQSIGSDEVTTESLQMDFKAGGIEFIQDWDFLAVLGHNLDTFKFQRFNGTIFVDIAGASATGETESFTLFPIANFNSSGTKLLMDTVQDPGSELQKQVGEILVLKRIFELPIGEAFNRIGINFRPVAKVTRMDDDGTIINPQRWAGNRTERYVARVSFQRLSKANYDSLRTVVKEAVFVVQPEPDQRPDEFFLVTHIDGGFPADYATGTKLNGYNLGMNLREV